MTPPDGFLQLLGAASVGVLLVLVRPFFRRGTRSRKPPQTFGAPILGVQASGVQTSQTHGHPYEREMHRAAHARDVMRPGLIHAAFDRDSVCMGDDTEDRWRLLCFEADLPISTVLGAPLRGLLPSIAGGKGTWVIELHEPLEAAAPGGEGDRRGRERVTPVAVAAQEWTAPRLLVPDFPVSQVGAGTLYARYLAQADPEHVERTQREQPNPRERAVWSSRAYRTETVGPETRVMIREPAPPKPSVHAKPSGLANPTAPGETAPREDRSR